MNFIRKGIKEFASFIGFIVLIQFFFLSFMHLFSLLISDKIFELANMKIEDSIWNFVGVICLTSAISFLFTIIVYYLSIWLKAREYFTFFFSLSNIINIYISGLISLIFLAKPYFIGHEIYKVSELPSDDIAFYAGLIFFISLTNNTIFKNLIIDNDIKHIWKVIKDVLKVIRG